MRAGPDDDLTDEIWEDAMPAAFVFADHAQVVHGFLFGRNLMGSEILLLF